MGDTGLILLVGAALATVLGAIVVIHDRRADRRARQTRRESMRLIAAGRATRPGGWEAYLAEHPELTGLGTLIAQAMTDHVDQVHPVNALPAIQARTARRRRWWPC
ncbi:hypothetical protein [Micrococcus luteus]|uniref:hypothetical protein n=1 Tax=Micrococcus luteus TaxID=1270 RepID=UPI00332A906F